MSDDIPPFDLQMEIMKRLPVKSLLQFRSVSKAWKSVIGSPPFIARYRGSQPHLLVSYWDHILLKYKYDSIVVVDVDDDTFPHLRLSITRPPQYVEMLEFSAIIGSSHGLFCLHNHLMFDADHITKAVIWNPSIRKAVDVSVPKAKAVVVPNAGDLMYKTLVGFGVCGETSDPKIVKIAYHKRKLDMFSISCVPWQVQVFTLSTRSWRSSCSTNLSRKSIQLNEYRMVVTDGVLYWLADERIAMDGDESRYRMLIVSFDMTSEEFGEVNLPDSVAHQSISNFSLYELRGSPVVLQRSVEADDSFYCVWMMEEGVTISFTKLLTFNCHTLAFLRFSVIGFRETGELIIEIDKDGLRGRLAVYEPSSKSLNYTGVNERGITHYAHSYVESLLLL